MVWDDAAITKLRALWDEKLPTAQIARLMGVSKNAAVGKAHRLNFPPRPSPIREKGTGRNRDPRRLRAVPLPALQSITSAEAVRVADEPAKSSPSRTPISAPRAHIGDGKPAVATMNKPCEFPIGGRLPAGGYATCGEDRKVDKPYCPRHCEIAYIQVKPLAAKEKWP